MALILLILLAIIIGSAGKNTNHKNEPEEELSFFDGGNDFTDEDIMFLEMIDD